MALNKEITVMSPEVIIPLKDAMTLQRDEVLALHKNYGNTGLVTLMGLVNYDRLFVKAEGTRVWDSEGHEFLDFLGAYGAMSLGHNHPLVLNAVEQVREMPNMIPASLPSMLVTVDVEEEGRRRWSVCAESSLLASLALSDLHE